MDFYEIDFLPVETKKSGDAIALRYEHNGVPAIHVVDGGYEATGEALVAHIRQYYGEAAAIDRVILTHPDGDHARGLQTVLREMDVRELWMLRPWMYADALLPRFARFQSAAGLAKRLKEIYYNTAALETIALERNIPIREPFQGAVIGAFTVLAPTYERYLDLVTDSDRTPQISEAYEESAATEAFGFVEAVVKKLVNRIKAAWGVEVFSANETSAENEMSVVQYAHIAGKRILLTGDAGRKALTEAADYAPALGLTLPGMDVFQVPHHGSRRNVSTALLDRWLGARLDALLPEGSELFLAPISSAKEDPHHPRAAVKRAFMHRGARVAETEGAAVRVHFNAPPREGWVALPALPYPEDQEE